MRAAAGARAVCRVAGLLLLGVVGVASVGRCDFGTLPGLWDGFKYRLVDPTCQLERHVENWATHPSARDGDHILLIGDSFDRQIVQSAANHVHKTAKDYTPVPIESDGKPSHIGRNLQLKVSNQYLQNMFIFGANNRGKYLKGAKLGSVEGMSTLTYDRICKDFRQYSSYKEDPSMVVINSLLWDARQFYDRHGRKSWQKGDYNVPRGISPKLRKKNIFQVFEPGPEGPHWRAALQQYEADITALIHEVRRCFPTTGLFCWRTAPLPSTDSRNRHFWIKPPYITAAYNSVSRHVAHKEGLCVLDLDRMLQGRGNDGHWVPDGSHPGDEVMGEYANVLLNTLAQHKAGASAGMNHTEVWQDASNETPIRQMAVIHPHTHPEV